MPIFEIETDQGVFEIDADREPTQAEALQAISGQAQVDPVQQVDPTPAFIPETPLQASQRASLTLPKALADIITGTVELGAEGVGGLVDILRKGSTDTGPTSVSEAIGEAILGSAMGPLGQVLTGQQRKDIAQTGLEAAPRAALELGAALRQPIEFARDEPGEAARRVIELNPLVAAIAAAVSPREALTPEQQDLAQQRAGRQEATARALESAIVPEIIGEANIPASRLPPLLLGAENIPAAISNLARVAPSIGREALRTGVTIGTTPFSGVRSLKAAEPFISGRRLSEAERGLESALTRQTGLERDIAQALERESLARGKVAETGREAQQIVRDLRRAERELNPQIVAAQTSIEEAANLPVVVIGKTAQEPAAFGRTLIEGVEGPLSRSKAQYTAAYKAVDESLPSTQPKLPSQGLFDAASTARQELSEGFEAFNKGQIKQIIGESTRVTRSTVPPDIQNAYQTANPRLRSSLLESYPELADPVGKIPEYNWNEMQRRFHQINDGIEQAVKYGNTSDVRTLQQLKQGVVSDMENYAAQAGTDTESLFRTANKQFQDHQNKFGLNRIQTLFKDDVAQNPQLVANKLITDNNAPMVEAIKGIVTPEEFKNVQAQFSRRIFSKNFDEPFDPAYFVKNFADESTHETLRSVFGQQGFNDLKRVYNASKDFAKVEDFQKTLNTLQSESESSLKTFRNKRDALKESLNEFKKAEFNDKIRGFEDEIALAREDIDRVKNWRDLKDWGRRFSGLNILDAASQTPAWRQMMTYVGAHSDRYISAQEE